MILIPYAVPAGTPWITLSPSAGRVEGTGRAKDDARVWVSVDWAMAPSGVTHGFVRITGAGREELIAVSARKPADLTRSNLSGFFKGDGQVAIDAEHFTSKTDVGLAGFRRVEEYGMRTKAPVDVQGLGMNGLNDRPHLDYRMYLFTPGAAMAHLTLGPALNFAPERPVRIARFD